ncbi:hypothetical protein N386_gp73 [Puniceispirillum phage HMO-2011]|nr:hypothetical protein N386_gp73 [Puniceispirillum phage HMO-2011]ADW08450.1 hypothetical protein phage1322_73 [Puniceispirillum phage HMO-2011]
MIGGVVRCRTKRYPVRVKYLCINLTTCCKTVKLTIYNHTSYGN